MNIKTGINDDRNHSAYPQRRLRTIPPLKFQDLSARIDMGGVQLKVSDGFLLADEAEALHRWLGQALDGNHALDR